MDEHWKIWSLLVLNIRVDLLYANYTNEETEKQTFLKAKLVVFLFVYSLPVMQVHN